MKLHTLRPAKGSTNTKKRLGRGEGSGMGGTSTRGNKGAKSRSGYSHKVGFEGGQMPLQRRVPKYGFNNPDKLIFKPINLDTLQQIADKLNVSVIDEQILFANGLMSKNDKVKVLNRGSLSKSVEVKAHAFSASAKESIEKAGGKATVI